MPHRKMDRRAFLRGGGAGAGLAAAQAFAASARHVSIVVKPAAPPPARWAAGELERALAARQVRATARQSLGDAPAGDLCVYAAGPEELLQAAGMRLPAAAEALALARGKIAGREAVLAGGSDARGMVYALLELADRVAGAPDPFLALDIRKPVMEQPANRVRSMARCFESDIEDKSWFFDRSMWTAYLSMLATQRFNRFSLTLGLGYNFPRNVTDVYFYFAYPFLLAPPGYSVRAEPLPDSERDRNLETLRFIGEQAVARGLEFQLGLWTHAYQWVDSPKANYTIRGLTPENHAAYCRDALKALLEACPAISGLTFRIHGESGIPEGSYEFWRTLFDGIVRSGRKVEIDMHAKGMDQKTIDIALATGMPVKVSPKYWAEHMGLGYHQAGIRELERAPREAQGAFALSSGSRRFLRYGYGDLLKEDRRYGILYRIWPGTQRTLLWGDPAQAAAYGRASSFCGSDGVEWCEPLSFKGRMGSGLPGGRLAYADASLNPKYDWEKFRYTYRVWGRLLYNPAADPESWRRDLRRTFAAAAPAVESGLAHASRILLLTTTAHGASGSNNRYWPEMYTNMPIADEHRPHPYTDTPTPRHFGTVSPFDPQLFSSVEEFASEALEGRRGGKYSPIEVAQWLEDMAAAALREMHAAEAKGIVADAEWRRAAADIAIQAGIGRFFGGKLRSAVLWSVYQRTGDRAAAEEALKTYRAARAAWAEFASGAAAVYARDVSYGREPFLRGPRRPAATHRPPVTSRGRRSKSGSPSRSPPDARRASCTGM